MKSSHAEAVRASATKKLAEDLAAMKDDIALIKEMLAQLVKEVPPDPKPADKAKK